MYDPINGYVYESRDVIWLKRMYYPKRISYDESDNLLPWPAEQDPDGSTPSVTVDQDGDDDAVATTDVTSEGENEEEASVVETEDAPPTPIATPAPSVTRSGRVSRLPQYIVDNYHYIGETGNM
eukprot:9031091-Ditylum_brightwellii.AAC.1